jgi:hypothetical protein
MSQSRISTSTKDQGQNIHTQTTRIVAVSYFKEVVFVGTMPLAC